MLCRGGRHTYRAMSITGSADRSSHISSLPPKTQPHSYSACWWITSSAPVDSSTIVSRFFLEVLLRVHCTIIEWFFSVVSRFQSSERHDVMISSSRNLCRVLATGRLGGRMHHMARHSLWIKILVSSFTDIIVFGKYSDYYTNSLLYRDKLPNFNVEKYFRMKSVRTGKTIKELRYILKSFHDGLQISCLTITTFWIR